MKAKLAHLFLVRDNLNLEGLWKKFFQRKGLFEIYVHAKWPHKIKSAWWRRKLIRERCNTAWGTVSLVRAELLLLKAALRDPDNQFFLLHSESCAPIRDFDFVYREITGNNRSWINYHRKNMGRYDGVNRDAFSKDDFYKCSQFFCLSRAHAELVVKHFDPKDWKRCFCADEHCIPSILAKYGELDQCIKRSLTYSRMPRHSPSPVTYHGLSLDDFNTFERTPSLFARKFAADSDIDKYFPISPSEPFGRLASASNKTIVLSYGAKAQSVPL